MMVRPFRLSFVGFGMVLSMTALAADEKEHLISSYLSVAIAQGLPKFEPAQKAQNPAQMPALDLGMTPEPGGPDVVRLPRYVVHGSRPMNQDQLQEIEGKDDLAMNRYLGDFNGLDRGLLNRFTFPELWSKVPVLHYLACPLPGMTNQARAMMRYREDERVAMKEDLLDLVSLDGHRNEGAAEATRQQIRLALKAQP